MGENAPFVALTTKAQLLTQSTAFIAALLSNCTLVATPVSDPVLAWVADTTADPFMFDPTGIRIASVFMDYLCMSQGFWTLDIVFTMGTSGCWTLDIVFTMGTNDTTNVLYLPRVENNDTLIVQDPYPSEVLKTFGIENFPCGCCMEPFIERYRPIQQFHEFVNSSQDFDICNASEPKLAPPSDFMHGRDYISRKFQGLNYSEAGLIRERYHILEREQGPDMVPFQHTIETFIGLAHFSPTSVRFLDSAASQTKVFLTKTDYFSLAVFHTFKGTMYYNFFDYANMRLHQVSVNHLQPFSYYQYIEVIFTLDPKYFPHEGGLVALTSVLYFPHEGGLVALNSVLIAQGTFSNLISGPVHYPNASQNWTEDELWCPVCHISWA
ncbi:hypothetical protein T484DRAFT_1766316 [Baffinella frigidus]|nr:hypothetical protein T484DRAFT_1766316 [Cryptophyta sp. CCMP2293]